LKIDVGFELNNFVMVAPDLKNQKKVSYDES
jgi:hypothetical protein